MRKVVVTIHPDGTTEIDAQGFKGKGCQDATQQLAIAIGGPGRDDSQDRKKPDFYASNTGKQAGTI